MNRKAVKSAALPEGWREVKLGEACYIDQETLSSKTPGDYTFEYISLSDVKRGKLIQTKNYKFSNAPSRARMIVKRGDVLLATVRPNLQGFYIFKDEVKDCVVSTGFAVLTPKSHLLDSTYLFQMLFSNLMLATYYAVNVGSNYPAINSSDIHKFKVFIPPLSEQKVIASLLETWDTVIEKTEALIAAKQKQFKWLLKTLISDQQDNPDWRKVKLGDISVFSKGNGITKKELVEESGIPCIRYGELYTRHNFRVLNFYSFIADKNLEKYKLVKSNDLLFAGSGETRDEIGKCASFNHNIKAYAGGDVIVCSIYPQQLRADFASYYLNTTGRKQISRLGQGDSIVHIYSRFLEGIEIPSPPLSEQKRIANILDMVKQEMRMLKQLTEQYRTQKRGLMQKLLTGEHRIVTNQTGHQNG